MGQDDPLYDDTLDRATWTKDVVRQPTEIRILGIDPSVESPFFTIWTRPRATIRGIVETDPTWHVVPIVMLAAISQALQRASTRNAGDQLSLSAILIVAIVVGPLVALGGLYVVGWLLGLTGRWLSGRARPEQIRAAIAWSSVPTLASLPIWIVGLALLGQELFTTKTPTIDAHPVLGYLRLTGFVVASLLRGWAFMVLLKCVGEVQGFSAWRALGSLLLMVVVVALPIVMLAVAFRL